MQQNNADAAVREFKAVVAIEPGRSGGGLHRPGGELSAERQARRGAQADAGRARNRAELRARAGSAAEAVGGPAVTRRSRAGRARPRCSLCTLVPALQPRVDAQLPTAADDRFAGLQWRFVRIKYHYVTEGTPSAAGLLRRAVADRRRRPPSRTCRAAIKTATSIEVEDPIVLTLDDPRLFTEPVDLFRRARQPEADRERRQDAARVPAARRHGDVRRFPRAVSSGSNFDARDEEGVSRSGDRRVSRRITRSSAASTRSTATRRSPGSARSWPAARWEKGGFVAAPARRSSTTTAARCCTSTGTPTWATAGSGRTPRTIPGYMKYTSHGVPDGHQRDRLRADALN